MINIIFNTHIAKIKKDIENSQFPKTAKALYRFYEKISSIKELLDKITDYKEIYVAKILLRVLFEHFIVAYYIFYRFNLEGNDKVGEDYYQDYFSSEFFKQKGYIQKIDNIRNSKTQNIHGLDYVKSNNKEFEKVTEKQYHEIMEIGNKFKIESILKQLNKKDDKTIKSDKLHEYMIGFLDEYNKLSSYVHGGPMAEKLTFDVEIDFNEDIYKIKSWGETSLNAMKENILLFLIDNKPEYIQLLKPIMEERIKLLDVKHFE